VRQLLDRFANPLILILLFASGLSAWTGEVTSFALIVGIILLSVVLDVVQQARAENTVDALRRSVGLKAEVLRNGNIEEVAMDRLDAAATGSAQQSALRRLGSRRAVR
jgi:Mg2+-importing ATPase